MSEQNLNQDNFGDQSESTGYTGVTPQETALIWGMETNTYNMLMHLSQLLNIFPSAGIVCPIVMWALNKDKNHEVDLHGRVILNWIISEVIYIIVSAVLILILIGIPMLITLVILGIVFPVMGAVKANNGVLWKYPMSITFFKVTD
ncbi:MAG: DUF4870 domain-containing protein [Thermoguttaceae bacterium]